MDSGVLFLEQPNGSSGSRRISGFGSKRSGALQIVVPQQENHQSEIGGLHSALDVVKKEIVDLQHEAEKLSCNIIAANQDILHLVSEIQKCSSDRDGEDFTGRRARSIRSRSESVFSTCSTARTSSTDCGKLFPGSSRVQRMSNFPDGTVQLEHQESIKQGWLWKTPFTPNAKSIKRRWTKRWFVLKGFVLSYYRVKENSLSPADMEIQSKVARRNFDLSSTTIVIRNLQLDDLSDKVQEARKFVPERAEKLDDNPFSFLAHLIFVQTQEGKLCLRAENTEVIASWLSLFRRRLMQTSYVERTKLLNIQPDKTVLRLLEYPDLEHWDFQRCADTEALILGLLDLLPNCSSVKSLRLAKCKLGDKELTMLQGRLASWLSKVAVEVLDLSENLIRPKGVSGLGLAISESSTLRKLVLDHNQLSDWGLEILARNVWGNARPIAAALIMLSVVDNGITDKGIQTLADILSKTQPPVGLEILYVGDNKICDQGTAIMKICKALPNITVDFQSRFSWTEIDLASSRRK